MNKAIKKASDDHKKAAEALIKVVQIEFPVGCHVSVLMGKSRVTGEVTGHSTSWWYSPGEVRFRNIKTGKDRDFSATYDGHEAERIS